MPSDPRFEQPLSGLYWQVAIEPSGPVLRSRSLWDFQLALPDAKVDDALHQSRLRRPRRLDALRPPTACRASRDARRRDGQGCRRPRRERTARGRMALHWSADAVPHPGRRPSRCGGMDTGEYRLAPAQRHAKRADRHPHRRTPPSGSGYPDEVQPLAREIDSLLDARDAQLEKARARAADLAHGLKTPLQVLSGEAERLRTRGAVDIAGDIESIAEDMQRHIERHLTRARLAPPSEDVSTNLRDIAERVAGVVERTPAGGRLTWSNTMPADLTARIDPDDLAEALGNLIDNATRHARSKVTISGASEREWHRGSHSLRRRAGHSGIAPRGGLAPWDPARCVRPRQRRWPRHRRRHCRFLRRHTLVRRAGSGIRRHPSHSAGPLARGALSDQNPASKTPKRFSSSHCCAAFSLPLRNASQVEDGFSAPASLSQALARRA